MTDTTPADEREGAMADAYNEQIAMLGVDCWKAFKAGAAWQASAASQPAKDDPDRMTPSEKAAAQARLRALIDRLDDKPAQEPVAFIDPKSIEWLRENPKHRVLTTQLRGIAVAGWMPLYAAPPATQQQAEPVAIPSFIRRPIEAAIQTAHNPPPGSMIVGMPKAYVATDKLAYLLRMFDAGLYAAPADDEAVRLLRKLRSLDTILSKQTRDEIDAYLAKAKC